jgi:pyridoxal phosphate enzyme (YggS family)
MKIELMFCTLLATTRSVTTAFSPLSKRTTGNIAASTTSLVRRMSAEASSTENGVVDITTNLEEVRDRMSVACEGVGKSPTDVKLIAVSKTKPLELLQQAYAQNQRIFGENYAQELVQKAQDMPDDVIWHYIGTLQSNKANSLVKSVVPVSKSLVVETVSTLKLANKLNNAMQEFEDKKLEIFVQVNTSGEGSKGGVEPDAVIELCKEIQANCEKLELKGLMTIGAVGDLSCFDTLVKCKEEVEKELDVPLKLSMGMSGDFEEAIQRGADYVRVGSTIFGARDYSNKK